MSASIPYNVTAGAPISDLGLLALVLDHVLCGSEFSDVRRDLLQEIRAALPADYEAVSDLALQLLESRMSDGKGADQKLIEAALQNVKSHRTQTQHSKSAYDPAGKENWKAVFWPDPPAPAPHGRPLHGELPFAHRSKFITKATPIGSAGSCFAREIREYLRAREYNYVVTEPNDQASAAWGSQYTTVGFQQTIEWAFGLRERPLLVWQEASGLFMDPFRQGAVYKTLEDVAPSIARHRVAARAALERSEVFIFTVGINEIWRFGSSDTVLPRYPRNFASYLVRNEILTYEQNLTALQRMSDVFSAFNPRVKLIVTVSPIPLYATFQGDKMHVVAATQQAKSILRAAVGEFAARNADRVIYFPAMETVLWCTKNPWQEDARHVSQEAVGNVMRLFEEVFVSTESPANFDLQTGDRNTLSRESGGLDELAAHLGQNESHEALYPTTANLTQLTASPAMSQMGDDLDNLLSEHGGLDGLAREPGQHDTNARRYKPAANENAAGVGTWSDRLWAALHQIVARAVTSGHR